MSLSVRLVGLDRLAGGLVITFSDGSCGFFSNDLLHSTMPSAQSLGDCSGAGLENMVLFPRDEG